MKILLILLFALASYTISAQDEPEYYKEVTTELVKNYNAESYGSIFELFGDGMKDFLPLEKTELFFKSLQTYSGNIKTYEFKGFDSGMAKYKTTFKNGLFALNVAVSKDKQIDGISITPYVEENYPVKERNTTKLILPMNGVWHVFWGGDTEEQNYHVQSKAQKSAFDLVITDEDGKSYKNDGSKNEDYYAFGKELIAPCDAEVVLAVDGVKDNIPGKMNPTFLLGNAVVLKTANEEYLYFAHFKQSSVKVKEGDMVKQGQVLGLCGNSGNSSEAHLHFHIQNIEEMNGATGAKCFFENIYVNGELKKDYSPVKGETISNKKL